MWFIKSWCDEYTSGFFLLGHLLQHAEGPRFDGRVRRECLLRPLLGGWGLLTLEFGSVDDGRGTPGRGVRLGPRGMARVRLCHGPRLGVHGLVGRRTEWSRAGAVARSTGPEALAPAVALLSSAVALSPAEARWHGRHRGHWGHWLRHRSRRRKPVNRDHKTMTVMVSGEDLSRNSNQLEPDKFSFLRFFINLISMGILLKKYEYLWIINNERWVLRTCVSSLRK